VVALNRFAGDADAEIEWPICIHLGQLQLEDFQATAGGKFQGLDPITLGVDRPGGEHRIARELQDFPPVTGHLLDDRSERLIEQRQHRPLLKITRHPEDDAVGMDRLRVKRQQIVARHLRHRLDRALAPIGMRGPIEHLGKLAAGDGLRLIWVGSLFTLRGNACFPRPALGRSSYKTWVSTSVSSGKLRSLVRLRLLAPLLTGVSSWTFTTPRQSKATRGSMGPGTGEWCTSALSMPPSPLAM